MVQSMSKFFCNGKAGFCDNIENCRKCEFANSAGVIDSKIADKILSSLFGANYDLPRIRELVASDRDGKCIILPCKIGSTVYSVGASICKWRDIDHCDEYCDGWQYRDCWEGSCTVIEKKFSLQDIASIGKTVFMSHEEAESALKGVDGGE